MNSNHPYRSHNESYSRLYTIWSGIKQRCLNPKSVSYKNYGGRGVKVCDEWISDFTIFSKWAHENGYADDLTIERIDVNGDYCPNNCKWITRSEQAKNRRNCYVNLPITCNGITKSVVDWCAYFGLNPPDFLDYFRRHFNGSVEAVFYRICENRKKAFPGESPK